MSERARKIISEATSLSEEERAELVEEILRTLNVKRPDPAAEAAWLMEVERRGEEMDKGLVEGISWEKVRAEGDLLLDE